MTPGGGRSKRERRTAQDRWQILRRHVDDGLSLTQLSRDSGVGLRTLQRWHAQFTAGGLAALEPAPRSDLGTRRTEPDLVALIEGFALAKPRRSIAAIKRVVDRSPASRVGSRRPTALSATSLVLCRQI